MLQRRSKQHVSVLKQIRKIFPLIRIKEEHHIGERLFLDIYIPRFAVAVEINGIQHYQFSQFFHGTQDKFELAKFLDKKKIRKCMELGIGIFVVKYDEEFNEHDFIDFATKHLSNCTE